MDHTDDFGGNGVPFMNCKKASYETVTVHPYVVHR